MIKVYHAKFPNYGLGKHPKFTEEDFDLVAEVDVPTLDEAYVLTQHIEREWSMNDKVKTIKPSRSTSIGDILTDQDGANWRCEALGWSMMSRQKIVKRKEEVKV